MEEQEVGTRGNRTSFVASFLNRSHRYKKLVFTYWWVVVFVVLLCAGLQFFFLWRARPSFTSTGRMIVNVKLSIPNANLYSEELNNFFGTQEELMLSDSVRNRASLRLQAADPQFDAAPVRLKVTVSPKTSIFNLSAIGASPKTTQDFLQAIMQEYVNFKRELLETPLTATRSSMQEELTQLASQLQRTHEDLVAYASNNSVVLLQSKGGNSAAEYLSSLTRQLEEHRSELHLLKALTLDQNLERQAGIFGGMGASSRSRDPEQPAAHSLLSSSNVVPLDANPFRNTEAPDGLPDHTPLNLDRFETGYLEAKQQLLLMKAKRTELSELVSPTARILVALDVDIAHQEKLLSIFQEQSEQQLKNRQQTLAQQIEDMETQIGEWNLKALDVSKKLSGFEALRENEKRLQSMFDQLQSTLHTIDFDKLIRQESVTILEPATPGQLTPPMWGKHLGIAAFVGLVLSVGILMLLDKLDDRPTSITELDELFREPILGQILLMPAKNKKANVPVLQMEDDRDELVEAYSNLRSALLFKNSSLDSPKSLVVTSASPGDGKSMVSASLAVSLAQAGARVLLVDADLRRGALHEHFSVSASPGFADVLAEQCAWAKTVVHTSIPNLDFLPCGARPHRPASLFVKNGEKFLKETANHYDYCLLDTTPVMAADDVSSLAPHVGGVLMVIRSGCTSGRIAQAALDSLYLRRANIVGLVFNGVRPGARDYYYYSRKESSPNSGC